MNGSNRGIPEGGLHEGSDTVHNINKILFNNHYTTVLELLTQNTNEYNNCRGKPPNYNPLYGIVETRETQKYIKVNLPYVNKVKTQQGTQVILPDGSLMQATQKAEINFSPLLSTAAKTPHIFPHIKPGALIYIGQVCGDGCTAIFTATNMTTNKKEK